MPVIAASLYRVPKSVGAESEFGHSGHRSSTLVVAFDQARRNVFVSRGYKFYEPYTIL